MTMLKGAVLGGICLVMMGCASTPRCPLGATEGQCSSMMDTYYAARAGGGSRDTVFSERDPSADTTGPGFGLGGMDNGNRQAVTAYAHGLERLASAGRHQLAGPVYTPAKPYKMWVAPWTDANGLVHSGENTYFVTPGYWSYGSLEIPGSAGGVLEPAVPTDLGFAPLGSGQAPTNGRNGERTRISNGLVAPEERLIR